MSYLKLEERVTALEVKIQHIQESQDKIVEKLDDLISLRQKGVGAFWLASALVGTGIVGMLTKFTEWLSS